MASSWCSSAATTHLRRVRIVCKTGTNGEVSSSSNNIVISSRRSICVKLITAATFASIANKANAAILEAEDDEELLEKVKNDRKKRLEKQGVISSSAKETAYLQALVYKMSEIGKALEKNDLSGASSVLGSGEWVQRVKSSFNKLSSSDEEKTQVDVFDSSFSSLISTVSEKDIEGSKVAFVECASAFEKWSVLSGLVEQLKGL